MPLRQIIRRLGRKRTFLRRLPDDLGGARFFASTEGGLKFLRRDVGKIDEMLASFARTYIERDAVVWDIGANVGLFTFMAAGIAGPCGHVYAVDADTWLVDVLRRSARKNPSLASVEVLGAAISDRVGLATFEIAAASRATSHLDGRSSTQTGGTRERQLVPTMTLDSLLDHMKVPNVVKIDVERHEDKVMAGARQTLEDHRPVVLVEVGHDLSSSVASTLRHARYRMLDARTGREVDTPTYDTICLPE